MNIISKFAKNKRESANIHYIIEKADKESWDVTELIESLPTTHAGLAGAFIMGMTTQKSNTAKEIQDILDKKQKYDELHDAWAAAARAYGVTKDELIPKLRETIQDTIWRVRTWKLIYICLGIIMAQLLRLLSNLLTQL